jgi:hypothetical protein
MQTNSPLLKFPRCAQSPEDIEQVIQAIQRTSTGGAHKSAAMHRVRNHVEPS